MMDDKEKLEHDEKLQHDENPDQQKLAGSEVSDDWESEEVKRKLRKI
jgi:hypothetical protein